ncbi:MAG: sigma 54-interacting transcriptional regulator, partial [Candidatus Korobacteraceae bacterium]
NSRLELLLDINHALVSNLTDEDLFRAVSTGLRKAIQIDYTSLTVYDEERNELWLHSCEFMNRAGASQGCMQMRVDLEAPWQVVRTRKPLVLGFEQMQQIPELVKEGVRSGCIVPLIKDRRLVGTLNVGCRRDGAFGSDEVQVLLQIGEQVALALDNARIYREVAQLRDRLADEKLYLEDEIRSELNFEDIVGESAALRKVLAQVETVAPSDSTVLILGETGTGKELIARAIHNLSRRQQRTFVKLNCAAIPTGLLESELFGHEKGAFTGAIERKTGRLELAHQGTLFLDEVGDIPLELQPKLLRALQEREFERLGSNRTQRVDMRLVAATNRNLSAMVASREFRSDLYYRLNVFPVQIPPLRERPEDIPLLVRHFTQKYARRMDKPIQSIPTQVMQELARWHWPGNVRELENFVERAVILTQGSVLKAPLSELREVPRDVENGNGFTLPLPSSSASPTLEAAERDHIVRVLREVGGVVGGPKGAAARLGLKRTTLISKMQRLGISSRGIPLA